MSYKSNTYHQFMLSYKIFLYLSSFFVKIKNNNFNFNSFIKDCEANSHKFSQNLYKEFNDIRDFLCSYNADEYVIEQTPKKIPKNCKPHLLIYIFL